MSSVAVNGIHLEYEVIGTGEPLLLIMGLGAQLILWPDEFCAQLVDAGFQVIRYDNRDIGLSTKATGSAPLARLVASHLMNRPTSVRPPYTLDDMADDAALLLEALGIASAHVVGASMGGMIAQLLALRYPDRVRSLGLIMTNPGGRWLGSPASLLALLRPRGKNREEVIEGTVKLMNRIGGTLPVDQQRLRHLTTLAYDRSYHPAGFLRQFAAVISAPDRSARLQTLAAPTAVLHGKADPLVPLAAGRALAKAIPNARLVEVDGMGHSLPPSAWPTLLDALVENARRAR